jgi:DNA-binding transcriptional ArsR family regulator
MTPALDRVLTAIADPTRRAILDRLALWAGAGDRRGRAVRDVARRRVEARQALERAGLVRRSRSGREQYAHLDARPLRRVAQWTSRYERFWNERLDRLEAHFTQKGQTR